MPTSPLQPAIASIVYYSTGENRKHYNVSLGSGFIQYPYGASGKTLSMFVYELNWPMPVSVSDEVV
jgi:hypothetical protein